MNNHGGIAGCNIFLWRIDMKQKFVFWMVCLMILPLAGVLASGSSATGGTGGKPEISISMLDRGEVPASEGSYENNRWTKWINENSPVNVKWVPITRSQSYDKVNALFAAGTAPDLVFEYNKSWMDYWYAQGVIQPVGDFIEQYSTNYKQYLAKHPELVPFITGDDGKIYGFTSARSIASILNFGATIRKDWLDKFGMTKPTTTAEVLNFFRRVRDEDPDGNGRKDTYGMNAAIHQLRNVFGADPSSLLVIENGHLVDWTTTTGYKDYLGFLALCYKEGYFDPEYITDTQTARERSLLVTGKIGMFIKGYSIGLDMYKELKANVPSAEVVYFEPWTTSYNKIGYYREPPCNYMAVMNIASKKGQPIIGFVDWLISSASDPLDYGFEGRHFVMENGLRKTINPEIGDTELYGEYKFLSTSADEWKVQDIILTTPNDAVSQEWARYQVGTIEAALTVPFNRPVPVAPTSDAIQRYTTETKAQIEAIETNVIMGRLSVDDALRQLNDYKNSYGWQAVNAERDAWYQKNKNNF
jgi:putative aldouronate transport system substrate-binding protein